jgi:membrane-associated phospholipid phosphatase
MPETPGPAEAAAAEVATGEPGREARRFLGPIALACVLLFAVDAWVVTTFGYTGFDRAVELFVQKWPWGPVVFLFDATNWLGGIKQLVFGLLVAVVFAIWDRRAGWLLFIGSGASLIDNLLKVSFHRHRPTADVVQVLTPEPGYSFPSGHAVFFTWLAVMVAAALAPRIAPRLRPVLWTLAAALIFIGCLGRVHSGVHWPTDVLGGFLVGLGWSVFVLWLPERWLPTPSRTWWSRGRTATKPAP